MSPPRDVQFRNMMPPGLIIQTSRRLWISQMNRLVSRSHEAEFPPAAQTALELLDWTLRGSRALDCASLDALRTQGNWLKTEDYYEISIHREKLTATGASAQCARLANSSFTQRYPEAAPTPTSAFACTAEPRLPLVAASPSDRLCLSALASSLIEPFRVPMAPGSSRGTVVATIPLATARPLSGPRTLQATAKPDRRRAWPVRACRGIPLH